ncbi:MAG: PPOX class F420-dependent oxidoreductase [Candidatus Micrarchaeota archaeon]|nr:PPOX class F420-dependent oxidoreductase [Candidatus Micrarchaeota archaeon]MDE1846530.1 PPOX class F420-dependent oxidoreductase [Candidatus Micrarchaeota archaeon]
MIKLPDKVIRLFEGKNFANIATLMPDGSPQVTTVWVDYKEGYILVNTAEGRVKDRNVRRDPRVAISIESAENPYIRASVMGKVVEVTHDGAEDHIDALAMKYMGKERYPWRAPGERRVIMKIAPNRVYTNPD